MLVIFFWGEQLGTVDDQRRMQAEAGTALAGVTTGSGAGSARARLGRKAEGARGAKEEKRGSPSRPVAMMGGSRSEMVYMLIREWITTGELRRGERIPEMEVARRAGVSRTPVREALKRLQAEGFVEVVPYRGVIVADPSESELAELCVVRVNLETLAAKLAVHSISSPELMALEQTQEGMEAAVGEGDVARIVAANNQFHETVWRASRNRVLIRQLSQLKDLIIRLQNTSLHVEARQEEACEEHRAIIRAFQERDADMAARLTEAHFQRAEALRLSLIPAATRLS